MPFESGSNHGVRGVVESYRSSVGGQEVPFTTNENAQRQQTCLGFWPLPKKKSSGYGTKY